MDDQHHLDDIREDGAVNPGEHQAPPSPVITKQRPRRGSSVSHVDVGFFDPAGVDELRRTMSRNTEDGRKSADVRRSNTSKRVPTASSSVSEATLAQEGPFNFEKTLKDFVKRSDEASLKKRELGVLFRDLRVVGLGASASFAPTLGSTINPMGIFDAIKAARHPPVKDILSGFEGVVRPGEMLLVLGSPGSGCSTLLKTLTNQRGEYHEVSGTVSYDSITPAELAKHYRGDVTYCPEDDVHFPTLTVQQTLDFAAKTRTPAKEQRLDGKTRDEYVREMTEVLMTIFGLLHVKDTPVGDAAIRGVSGGQKKRVSIAEALAGRSLLCAWDNSTRGLDSSTALEFVRALRIATDIGRLSTIVSIYQASESLYTLFDKVCVIDAGRMVYFGPADRARAYFEDMGYVPANRQTTADYLVACTDPKGRTPAPGRNPSSLPRTADEFARYFMQSQLAKENRADMAAYEAEFVGQSARALAYRASVRAEHAEHTRGTSAYTISLPMQVRAVMVRRAQVIWGNVTAQVLQLASFIIQGIIMGTVFLRVPDATSAYFSRGGVLFFALLFSALTSMAEIPSLFVQRPIVGRHEKAAMYHPFIEAAALTLVDVPITFITSLVFATIIYESVKLQQSAAQFFVFFLFLFTMTLTMKAWFRMLAAACKSEATAQAVGGMSVLVLVLYTGYAIPMPSMIGALRWITYINPLRYGFEGLITNEFRTLNGVCSNFVPMGPGYEGVGLANQVCTTVGAVAGEAVVNGARFAELSYGYSYVNAWRNYGIVVAFGVAFLVAYMFFTEFNTSFASSTSVVLFKRGSTQRIATDAADTVDEEKASGPDASAAAEKSPGEARATAETALALTPAMTDVFSWQHMEYVVPIGSNEHRKLLDDVTGYVAPGKLTALMGESGAGKTTLLNVLAERQSTGVVSGDRLVNGQPLPQDFQAQTGYCQQMDTHVPESTVRESLLFSARMRQPASVSEREKEEYVETCLKMCGLEDYADALVGSLGIEHRKRTTIGVELAAKPKLLLFLDEPTSGLDSQSAWAIMSFLRSLADNGQAILCTIHQPSAELFQVFDRLLLLRRGGQTVYFGDLGENSSTLIRYFEENKARPCQPEENPAEYMLDVIGAGATATSAQDWHDVWVRSKECSELERQVDQIHQDGINRPAVETARHSEFASSWMTQTIALCDRNAKRHWRDPTYLMAKLVLNIVGGLFVGFTFWRAKDSQQGAQNKLFAIYMATILSVPLSNQLQVPYIKMRNIYEIRERPSRMYSWTAFVTSQLATELPWDILGSIFLFFCWYWTVGFPNDRAGYTFLMMGIAYPLYYSTFGLAVAAMAPNAEIAGLVFSLLFSFVLTFNGVLQPYRQLGWWQWMYHLSPYTYLIEGLLGQAIGKQSITCSATELVTLNPPSGQTCGTYMAEYISNAGGYLTNSNATSDCQFCSIATTDAFLAESFNIYYSHHWRNFGFMMVFMAFNITLMYLFTYFFRIRTGSLFGSLKKRLSRKST
ncbi:pleiotropic drug resistance ABC transporter [Athelia psychrophila]|uniref:Pleiotropic drug resistance ABC transporter n=1 Tax=Athelia psychrophila TaxID=1759441 RepID=A0A166QD55_9AGAM|nr:pleiotropic drug resistance ABC transporter [Fibularhizoctonia sp. CBS 109695]